MINVTFCAQMPVKIWAVQTSFLQIAWRWRCSPTLMENSQSHTSSEKKLLLICLILSDCTCKNDITLKIEDRFLWGLDRLPQESWFMHHGEWGYEALCFWVACIWVIDGRFSCALLISYYTRCAFPSPVSSPESQRSSNKKPFCWVNG